MDSKSSRPHRRHFSYKHPTFGTKSRPKSERAWKQSVYYWWWAYLRKNEKYRETCESGGRGPMADLYKDFGDVRTDDFKAWWMEHGRGATLFAEPPVEESVRVLEEGEKATNANQALTISFPLNLPKKFLEKWFKQLLKKHHTRKRGEQLARKSQARYRIEGQPNVAALELDLTVYDYRKEHPSAKLWEIGNSIPGFQPHYKLKPTDDRAAGSDKKRILAIVIRRHIRRAEERIEKTGRGEFL